MTEVVPNSNSTTMILRGFAFATLAFVALVISGCESVDDGGPGYYTGPQVSPVDGASMMQDRLGQITRSQIR